MKLQSRVHPDFRTCALPAFAAWSPKLRFDVLPRGFVPLKRVDPRGDPDIAPTQIGNLYEHRKFPGVLFKQVSGLTELFRLGSNFVIGQITSANDDTIVGWVGPKAEHALLTGLVPKASHGFDQSVNPIPTVPNPTKGFVPPDCVPTSVNAGHFVGASGVNYDDLGSMLPDMFRGATKEANTYKRIAVSSQECWHLAGAFPSAGQEYGILAVITEAEYGEFHTYLGKTDSFPSYAPGPYKNHGWLGNAVPTKTIKQVMDKAAAKYLEGLDSDLREFAAEAIIDELALSGSEMLYVGVGVVFIAERDGATNNIKSYTKGFGLLTPANGMGTSREALLGSMDPIHYGWTCMGVVPWSELKQAEIDSFVSRLCYGDFGLFSGEIQPIGYFTPSSLSSAVAETVDSLLQKRAIAYSAAFNTANINATIDAQATTYFPGTPQEIRVGSLDTSVYIGQNDVGAVAYNPLTYGAVYTLRNFFRRVAKRTERLVKAS